jgi:predicted DNA-binding transcriptional regulator AlpA
MKEFEKFLNQRQVRQKLGISFEKFKDMEAQGMPRYKMGKNFKYRLSEVLEWSKDKAQ